MAKGKEDSSIDKAQIWSTHIKGEMAEVLTDAYMSSMESDREDGRLVYVVKIALWESEELKERKRKLDRIHTKKPIQTLTAAGGETPLKAGCMLCLSLIDQNIAPTGYLL